MSDARYLSPIILVINFRRTPGSSGVPPIRCGLVLNAH
jgi:hypothetical protein